MKRTIVALAAVALVLTACSTTDPKAEILTNVRAAAIEQGLTEEQANCVISGLSTLSVEQLKAIGDGTADADTTQAYTFIAAQCLATG